MTALDAYGLKARYYPTAIVMAPFCLTVLSFATGRWNLLNSLWSTAVLTLGLALVMEQIGRDQGKKKETELFRSWGGKPTTRFLRHRDSSLDRTTLERYHARLSRLVEGIEVPTVQQEKQGPNEADSVYDSCAAFLREQTRDSKRFPLISQENMNYGFRRNLWGMKPTGIVISAVGAVACSAVAIGRFMAGNEAWLVAAICGVVCIVLLALWVLRFTPSWVRTTAEEYARQLLSACDSLNEREQGHEK